MKFFLAFLILMGSLYGECRGKIDVAPLYLKADLLKFGKRDQTYHMMGARGAVDYFIWKPFLVRLTGLGAWGPHNSHFQTYTAGLGVCLPYQQFYFTPTAGGTYTRFSADNGTFQPQDLKGLDQSFHSLGPYVGFDIQWCLDDTWRIAGGFQYSWSRTSSTLRPLFKDAKDNSKGPTWTLQLEKDLNDNWSINIAGAYNRSLNHEKHGLKAQGVKVGLTYWIN